MSTKTESRLTPRQRFARGLKYSAVGPVDVTRGALGLGVHGAQSSAAWVGDRYRRSRLKDQLARNSAPRRRPSRRSSPPPRRSSRTCRRRCRRRAAAGGGARWCWSALGVAALAVGAVAFSIIRRSTQPEPSPLPPSVEVTPKP